VLKQFVLLFLFILTFAIAGSAGKGQQEFSDGISGVAGAIQKAADKFQTLQTSANNFVLSANKLASTVSALPSTCPPKTVSMMNEISSQFTDAADKMKSSLPNDVAKVQQPLVQ
jgi:uncharacterized protein (UPF0333 family)